MRAVVGVIEERLGHCGFSLNPGKCWTLWLNPSGRQKLVKVEEDMEVCVGGIPVTTVSITGQWTYLGVAFGPGGRLPINWDPTEELALLHRAPLKPQQWLEVLRTHTLPSKFYSWVLGRASSGYLRRVDVAVRSAVRTWTHLPHDVPNAYIHAAIRMGGLGIPEVGKMVPAWSRARVSAVMAEWGDTGSGVWGEGLGVQTDGIGPAEVRDAVADELYATEDERGLRESSGVAASSRWIRMGRTDCREGSLCSLSASTRAHFRPGRGAVGADRLG